MEAHPWSLLGNEQAYVDGPLVCRAVKHGLLHVVHGPVHTRIERVCLARGPRGPKILGVKPSIPRADPRQGQLYVGKRLARFVGKFIVVENHTGDVIHLNIHGMEFESVVRGNDHDQNCEETPSDYGETCFCDSENDALYN